MSNLALDTQGFHSSLGPLRHLPSEDAVSVWIGSSAPETLDGALQACCQLPPAGKRLLVLWLPKDLPTSDVARHARKAARFADRVVLIGSAHDMGEAVAPSRVLVEDDPFQAVVATMQWLRDGDALILLAPDAVSRQRLRTAARAGTRWRAAWDEPEGGEFHEHPRPADLPWQRC